MNQGNLLRRLGIFSVSAVIISNMIGTGIFTTTGFLAGDLGNPAGVVLIWLLGSFIALTGALSYAELGMNFPESGGEYVYLRESFGPGMGFVDGWISFLAGFSAPIAAATLALTEYLGVFFPQLSIHSTGFGPTQIFSCGVITIFTIINFLGIEFVGKIQNTLTVTKLLVIGTFIIAGLLFGDGNWSHFTQSTTRTSNFSFYGQLAISLIFVSFAYSGWNSANYIAGEIKDPQKNLPRSILIATLGVTVIYMLMNLLFIYALPLENMKGVVRIGAEAAKTLFGQKIAGLFSALLALSLLATINAMSMAGPRVYYAMAKDKAFFSAAAKLHPTWNSPWVAVLMQGICACSLILIGTFRSLITYIGVCLVLFSALSVVGLLRLRRRPNWITLKVLNIAYPTIPLIFIFMSAWILVYTAIFDPKSVTYSALTVLSGLLIYYLKTGLLKF